MTRVVALVLAILAFLPARAGDVSPVTITKRAPIESLDSSGSVAGVAEAKIGDKYVLISAASGQLTLQDAKGNHYIVAVDATDYIPPTTPAAPPVLPATPPPAPTPSPAPASAPALPPPPVIPAPDSAAPTPDSGTPGAGGLPADSAMQTVQIGDRSTAKDMSVWPPGGIAGRPLLIAAHGNGGAGPREIKGWLKLARSHHFTIVCPSFLSSVNSVHLSEDEPYFNDCIKWMKDNLQFDHANVFMVGFSGGGFPTWYLATKHPDFFRGLALQSLSLIHI